MQYAIDRPAAVASLALIDSVSPYGFGATKDAEGTPTSPDFAGSGADSSHSPFIDRQDACAELLWGFIGTA